MSHYISYLVNILPELLISGGYWILSIIVLLESLPIIGSFFPGHVAIIFAGFLVKLGMLNIWMVLFITIVMTVLSDTLGFLLGRRYGYSFLDKFGKYIFMKNTYLDKAKNIIDKHTGKTIILGKFSPMTRSLIPFLVGASGAHIKTFWLYNIIGGIVWVVSSVAVGYIFGAGYSVAVVFFGKFILVAIIGTILIVWGYHFVNLRFHIFRKYELFVLGLNLISLWAILKTIQDSVSTSSFMINFDISVNLFMAHFVTPFFAKTATFISLIFDTKVMLGLGLIIGFIFFIKKRWRRAVIMISSVGFTAIIVTIMKELFMRVRPENALKILHDSSFPSGHASLAAAFFIAIIYIYAPKIRSLHKREIYITFCAFAIIITGISRILLNVHWASDVIAGWSLGVFVSTGTILFVRYLGFFFSRRSNDDYSSQNVNSVS